MRVLSGVVYSRGPRTEPWRTHAAGRRIQGYDRLLSHLTRKHRDDRYDLNELRSEPRRPNHDERREMKMLRLTMSKAAKRSKSKA